MATYIAMTVRTASGFEGTIWQKIEVAETVTVIEQRISYVDETDTPVSLDEPYEMDVITGEEHPVPGVI